MPTQTRQRMATVQSGLPTDVEYAKPVAWMLVRDAGTAAVSGKEQMRTEIGHGTLNNAMRKRIEADGWRVGSVIGLFETEHKAREFAAMWKSDEGDRATRGPLMRFSRGVVMAELMERQCWVDFSVISNSRDRHWETCICDGFVYARPKTLVATNT